jgi:hypothetical protein
MRLIMHVVLPTYTVRFFHGSQPDYVTVDSYLPFGPSNIIDINGQRVIMANGAETQPYLWVALAEKAYVQESAAGLIGSGQPQAASYNMLNSGDPKWVFSAITGLSATTSTQISASAIGNAWSRGDFVVLTAGYHHDGTSWLISPWESYAVVGHSGSWFTLSPLNRTYCVAVDASVLSDYFTSWTDARVTGAIAQRQVARHLLPAFTHTEMHLDRALLASLQTVKDHGGTSALPLSLDAAVAAATAGRTMS